MGGSDCELLRDGWLAQPANAWTSLAYVIAAVVVLARCHGRAAALELVPGALALAVVGVGSFAFHGPQPGWADAVHDGGIAALLAAVLLHLLRRRRVPAVAIIAAAVAAAMFVLGRTDGPLCSPGSLVQPHAGWHVLTALAAAVTFMHRPPRSDPHRRRA